MQPPGRRRMKGGRPCRAADHWAGVAGGSFLAGGKIGAAHRIAFGGKAYYIARVKTITCKVPEALAAQLESLARVERRSKSDLMREALEARLDAKPSSRSVSAFDLVKHLCGSLKGGPSDLATNPEHMKGFGE